MYCGFVSRLSIISSKASINPHSLFRTCSMKIQDFKLSFFSALVLFLFLLEFDSVDWTIRGHKSLAEVSAKYSPLLSVCHLKETWNAFGLEKSCIEFKLYAHIYGFSLSKSFSCMSIQPMPPIALAFVHQHGHSWFKIHLKFRWGKISLSLSHQLILLILVIWKEAKEE